MRSTLSGRGASGYSRGPRGLPGASGYSRGLSGASWGLRLLPGPSGASWGLRLPRGPFHSLLNRYGGGAGLCGWVRPWVRQGRSAQRPGRSFLSTPAREGRASAPPRRACDRPLGLSFSQHREKIGWGSLGICIVAAESCAARWSGRGASGYSRGPQGASWGLRLLPGLSGASWGLRLPLGPSGASWGLRLLPGPFHSLLNRYGGGAGLCGWVRPLGSAGKKRAAPRALLPVDAGPRGGERRRPRGGRATAPWACPFSQHREKSGGGLLNLHCGCGIVRSTLERSRGLRLPPGAPGGFLGPPVTPGALWGLLGPPVTPGGPLGLLGPPVTPGGPFTPC